MAEALERVGLAGIDRRPVRTYSLGMRQRLGLAGALLTTPDLLILDEPTNGLDPHGIREIRELLVELNEEGTTVFLSSHLLAEIEALCTRVGVVNHGELVLEKPLDEVRHATGRIVVTTPDVERALAVLGRAVVARTAAGGLVVVPADGDGARGLARHLVGHDVRARRAGAGAGEPRGRRRRADRAGERPRGGAGQGPPVIAVELRKLFRRPRTWVTIGLLCLLPAVVAGFLASTRIAPPAGQGAAFLSAVLQSGSLYPAAALALVLPIFLPVAVAVVAGDAVAGESSVGTLRYLLVRPVRRTALLGAKLVSVIAFVVVTVAAVAGTSYVVGVTLFGAGDPVAVVNAIPQIGGSSGGSSSDAGSAGSSGGTANGPAAAAPAAPGRVTARRGHARHGDLDVAGIPPRPATAPRTRSPRCPATRSRPPTSRCACSGRWATSRSPCSASGRSRCSCRR